MWLGMSCSLPQGRTHTHTTCRCCSVDGDADRLVLFSPSSQAAGAGAVMLIDGDRIATPAAAFIKDLLDRLPQGVSAGVKASTWGRGQGKHLGQGSRRGPRQALVAGRDPAE